MYPNCVGDFSLECIWRRDRTSDLRRGRLQSIRLFQCNEKPLKKTIWNVGLYSLRIKKQSEEKKKNKSQFIYVLAATPWAQWRSSQDTDSNTNPRATRTLGEHSYYLTCAEPDTWEKAIEATYCCITVWDRYSQNQRRWSCMSYVLNSKLTWIRKMCFYT